MSATWPYVPSYVLSPDTARYLWSLLDDDHPTLIRRPVLPGDLYPYYLTQPGVKTPNLPTWVLDRGLPSLKLLYNLFPQLFPSHLNGMVLLKQWFLLLPEWEWGTVWGDDPRRTIDPIGHASQLSFGLPQSGSATPPSPATALDFILSFPTTTTNIDINSTWDKASQWLGHDLLLPNLLGDFEDHPDIPQESLYRKELLVGDWALSRNYHWAAVPTMFAILALSNAYHQMPSRPGPRMGLPLLQETSDHDLEEEELKAREGCYRVLCDIKFLHAHRLNLAATIQFHNDLGWNWYNSIKKDGRDDNERGGDGTAFGNGGGRKGSKNNKDKTRLPPPITQSSNTITLIMFLCGLGFDLTPMIDLYIESLIDGIADEIHIHKHYDLYPGWTKF